jgi:hypothetical protein
MSYTLFSSVSCDDAETDFGIIGAAAAGCVD